MASPKDTKSNTTVIGTDVIHSDDEFHGPEVVPSISVSTTFRQPKIHDDMELTAATFWTPTRHVYSRYTQPISTRVERVLSKVNQGYALTYSSGLAAGYAALIHLQPKRIAITEGYHGMHLVVKSYVEGRPVEIIGIDDEFQAGDVCWLETPLNPTGEARDIKYYADKVHAVGGKLVVDSTFAPPPLQYPFKWGADIIMHSGTKYFGGHSDLLCGVLVVKSLEEWGQLHSGRLVQGNVMGSLESWLLLRSLRTLHLRVPRQSESATALAQWLNKVALTPKGQTYDGVPGGLIQKVWHSSLQGEDARGFSPEQQLEGGFNPTFAMMLERSEDASVLPHILKYFIPATSLGGVESLVEQRIRSDPGADPRLIRISVGVEGLADLKNDLRNAFQEIAKNKAKL